MHNIVAIGAYYVRCISIYIINILLNINTIVCIALSDHDNKDALNSRNIACIEKLR